MVKETNTKGELKIYQEKDSNPTEQQENQIEVKGVTKSFRARSKIRERYKDRNLLVKFFKKLRDKEREKVLENISLKVKEGEIIGVLGPNGAGKTTLMKICTGLMGPDEGKVEVLGHDVLEEPQKIRERIDGIFARANLYRHLSTEDNLRFFCKIYGVDDYEEKIEKQLKKLGIEDRKNAYVDRLSTGERTKAKLIKAFLTDAEVLFLDEPTSGLDPKIALDIQDYIKELRSKGITILMCTHSMREAKYLCDRVIMMNKGKLVEKGVPEELEKELEKGKVIEYHLKSFDKGLVKKLDEMNEIENVRYLLEEEIVKVILKKPKYKEKVTEKLEKKDVEIDKIQEKEPTLEDVFIHLTGRELE